MKKTIDLTHSFDEHTIYWPTEGDFIHTKEQFGETDKGYFYSSYRIDAAEHGGTHIDAPIHFNESGQTLDQISLDRLMGEGVVIDVQKACKNRDYRITKDDLHNFEKTHNVSLNNKIVLLMTGYAQYWPDRQKYMGTDERGIDAVKKLHFPGLHKDAARFLVEERNIRAVGIDTPSIDYGQTSSYETHRILAKANTPAFENVAHLDKLPAQGFEIIALPMKIKNGSGGPLRIIARILDQH